MKVLVVEDDEFTRTLLIGAVSSLGHQCVAAVDGLHGWSHIQTDQPDVVISDTHMPGMNGRELFAKVRGLDSGRSVYFLLMTSDEDRQDVLEALESGVDDYLLKPVDLDELQARLVVAERWIEVNHALVARRDELELVHVQLRESAERDPLTRAYNRMRLSEDMTAVADRVNRYGHGYAIALFDIDHFRAYNETYGHVAGDEALIRVADIIAAHRRAGDTVYRYGGEEFLLLLPEQTLEGAQIAAERIRTAIADSPVRHDQLDVEGHVSVSVGIAEIGEGERAFEEALHRADTAVHRAKQQGRNQTVLSQDASQPQ